MFCEENNKTTKKTGEMSAISFEDANNAVYRDAALFR